MKPRQALEYLQSKGVGINYQHLIYLARKGYVKSVVVDGKYIYTQADLDKYLANSDNGKVLPNAIFHYLHKTVTVKEAIEYIKANGMNACTTQIYNAVKHHRLINSGDGLYAFTLANLGKYIVWLKKYKELFTKE
jgi:archaeosine-15-forming tRNA-guanine transglycosylase